MTHQGIETQWLSYQREVLPENATPVQLQECRRAFFCGATALFLMILTTVSPGLDVTEKDLDLMAGVHAELQEFQEAVLTGRA